MSSLVSIKKKLAKHYPYLSLEEKDRIGIVSGLVTNYEDKLKAGFLLAKTKYFEHIVNKIKVENFKDAPTRFPSIEDKSLDNKEVDVLIIGGGVTGCAIARELSKYDLKVLLIDKEEDVAMHASSRNDGNVHVGLDLKKNSKKLHYLQRSKLIYENMCKDLDVDYKLTGQGIVLTEKKLIPLIKLYLSHKAKQNKVPGVEFCNKKRIHELEPNLSDDVVFGAVFHSAAQVNPYQLTIALIENAITNGVEVSLSTYAKSMKVEKGMVKSVETNKGTICPKIVVNAAGVFSEDIAIMASDHFFSIHPRKGTDIILDKKAFKNLSNSSISIFHLGSAGGKTHSKGGGVIPTVDENNLVGPDAIEQPYKEDFSVDLSSVNKVIEKQQEEYKKLYKSDIISYFSGIRAATYEEDFIVQKGKWTKNIIHAAGIQSPGLTCAPAIAEDIAKLVKEELGEINKKSNWNGMRKDVIKTRNLSDEERDELIKKNANYGLIICRCEQISKGEILDALKSPLPPITIDGVKRRVRAGMGRCQGGFCQAPILKMMSEYNNKKMEEINKKGDGQILFGDIKGGLNE